MIDTLKTGVDLSTGWHLVPISGVLFPSNQYVIKGEYQRDLSRTPYLVSSHAT
jgi:hypothetical protein